MEEQQEILGEETPQKEAFLTRSEAETMLQSALDELRTYLSNQVAQAVASEGGKEGEIQKREEELQKRERREKIVRKLREAQLPEEMADVMDYESEEKMTLAIEHLEALVRSHVQKAVEARLSTPAPKAGSMQDLSQMDDQDYYATVYQNIEQY